MSRLLLVLALLLAPVLHSVAAAAPDRDIGCPQDHRSQKHASGALHDGGDDQSGHGAGVCVVCAQACSCSPQSAPANNSFSRRTAALYDIAATNGPDGRTSAPEPAPPRHSC
ncbi:MAG: hypothetical protein FJX42_02620 [Alphaproteobacteria bacterium]|nr:hypothetical protein [Alphaproteobacteria bacterium]